MVWHDRTILGMAALGLASGLASAFLGTDLSLRSLQPLASIFLLHASLLPIGVFYAAAMATACWVMVRRLGPAVIAFLAVLYGWSGAVHIAIRLQRHVGDDAHLVAASLAAGAFGAGLVHVGFAVSMPNLRGIRPLLITCAVGAAAGMLYYCSERGFIDHRVLFVLWQPAVALAIGFSARREPGR